jgi:hypothetical protein
MRTTRKLKVYSGHHGPPYKQHPVIRIAGQFLVKQGFKIGDEIEIEMDGNVLTVKKVIKQNT